jgi:large subunit ribosomal protein L34
MQTTFRPHVKRRYRVHGFLHRMKTHGGREVLRRRRARGRKNVSIP